MKGFIKMIWGKVSVDNLVVCQRCRSLWSTCTSNALPHRWRNQYRAQGQGKRSLEGWIMFREDHVPDPCMKVVLWTPRRFLCWSATPSVNTLSTRLMQSSFKHCLVTLYRDHGICSSKDVCLFLLKRYPVAGVLESNAVMQSTLCQ